jgi:anti-sigma factor ChrR (cupin superfamily)
MEELAPLYALDALEGAEKEVFEAHLRSGCAVCEEEVRELREVSGAVGQATPADPPPGLRDRLLARVLQAPPKPGIVFHDGGLLVARSEEVPWRQVVPGVEFKRLFVDRARKYSTSMIRMNPGSRYPSHRHRDVEELFILSGELHVSGQVLHSGDYCRAEVDTVHDETYSQSGCVFLLIASQQDEILA